ncbi:MAG: hypothetical protein LC777_01820 [Actinobacteria bacterium]|nr:hypothetical protein [Actinomycetota bacterium]
MTEHHRYEAHATIRPGEHEQLIYGSRLQLVRVVLTDDGPVAAPDGSEHQRPDVVCPLRPAEARELAARLLALATQAEQTTTPR